MSQWCQQQTCDDLRFHSCESASRRCHAIIGTFALDGPERCSGLMRYDAASLGKTLGPAFRLIETRRHEHLTPMGGVQRFQFSWFETAE